MVTLATLRKSRTDFSHEFDIEAGYAKAFVSKMAGRRKAGTVRPPCRCDLDLWRKSHRVHCLHGQHQLNGIHYQPTAWTRQAMSKSAAHSRGVG